MPQLLHRIVLVFLLSGIQAAAADSPIVVDGDGRAIGYLLGNDVYCNDNAGDIAVISKSGYFACITRQGQIDIAIFPPGASDLIFGLYYLTADCSGVPFFASSSGEGFTGAFVLETPIGLYMSTLGTQSSSVPLVSILEGFRTCKPASSLPSIFQAIPALVSDHLLSGLSDVPYRGPPSVLVLPDSALDDVIFFDGFEPGY